MNAERNMWKHPLNVFDKNVSWWENPSFSKPAVSFAYFSSLQSIFCVIIKGLNAQAVAQK